MKSLSFLLFSLVGITPLSAQSNLRVEAQRQEWNQDLTNVRLEFDSDASGRYLIEVSDDLLRWEPHHGVPFQFSEEGYLVRQLDASNPYTPKVEFYRVTRLPWTYQTIANSGSIRDVSLSLSANTAFLAYRNNNTDELFFTESDEGGVFSEPSVITSGPLFKGVTLSNYDGWVYIVCTNYSEKRVVVFWKEADSEVWNQHRISEIIDNHFWSFPKFSISNSGILGVAYANNAGTVFAFASHSSPNSWTQVFLTTSKPFDRSSIETTFSSNAEAHVYIPFGSYKIDTETTVVTSETFPNPEPSDLTEEEEEKIDSAYRSESVFHTRLSDGRILLILSDGGRVISAVEEK